ncbi:putative zinc transporter [Vitis vinifera]|uniref:Putative zinc transporter n=1 Tax=Vitis vinifera TaxID=29760 RepID=A0A438GR25_VITVI|nr:putative zinc transporter [Vitis vinifera]
MLLLKCQWKVDKWHEDLQAVVLRSVFWREFFLESFGGISGAGGKLSGSCWTGLEDILKHCIFPGRFRVFEAERELTIEGHSQIDPQWARICNGMAAGVMLAALFDLVQEGQEHGIGNWVMEKGSESGALTPSYKEQTWGVENNGNEFSIGTMDKLKFDEINNSRNSELIITSGYMSNTGVVMDVVTSVQKQRGLMLNMACCPMINA